MKKITTPSFSSRPILAIRAAAKKIGTSLLIALLSLGVVTSTSDIAAAVASMTLTVDYTPDSTAVATDVARGNKIDLTAGQPVAAAGTTSQEIIQQLPPELSLQSASDVIAPAGWVVSYSVDGITWSVEPPLTETGWKSIRFVKAAGTLISQGTDQSGRQLAASDSKAVQPSSGSFSTASSTGGDGWDVFFDDTDKIFNITHHTSTAVLDCHLRATGARCAGYPFNLFGTGFSMNTSNLSTGHFMASSRKVWIPTLYFNSVANTYTGGLGCVNIAVSGTPSFCTTKFVSAGPGAVTPTSCGLDCVTGLAVSGTRIFTTLEDTGDILCIDTALNSGAGAACANGGNIDFGASFTFASGRRAPIGEFNGKIYSASFGKKTAVCIDALTLAACPGWSNPRAMTTSADRFFELPSTVKGAPSRGACFVVGYYGNRGSVSCFNDSGADITSTLTTEFVSAITGTLDAQWSNFNPSAGNRLYWGDSSYQSGIGASAKPAGSTEGAIYCWDFNLNNWCTNWTSAGIPDYQYQIAIDPKNEYCIYSNGHDGIVQTFDAYTGLVGNCGVPSPVAVFLADSAVPRMSCKEPNSIQGWKSFELTSATTYTSATLSVTNSSGAAIAGWTNLTIPGTKLVDLSNLTISQTGQSPSFSVTFVGRSGASSEVTARITAIGGSPELCLTPTAAVVCTAPFFLPSEFGANQVTVTASGNSVAGSTVTALNGVSAIVNIAQSSKSICGGDLSGTARTGSNAPIPNSTVTLYDDSGATLATTTTDSSGAYLFENLVHGSYKVGFNDATDGYSVTSTAVAAGGSGTTSDLTTATTLTSATAVISPGVDAVVNATYTKSNTLTKAFVPAIVADGEVSTLVFQINNNGTARTGVGFVDTFPAGLTVAPTANIAKACFTAAGVSSSPTATVTATPGDNKITVTGMTIASTSVYCRISVSVLASTGTYVNTHSNISGLAGGLTEDVGATLDVVPATSAGAFLCDSSLYAISSGVLSRFDPIKKTQYSIGTTTTSAINGAGYNSLDGFIYGVATAADAGKGIVAGNLVRYKNDGSIENLGAITGALTTPASVKGGDMDNSGNLIVKFAGSTSTLYSIDVTTRVSTAITLSSAIQGEDLGYAGGKFFASSGLYLYTVVPNATTSWTASTKNIFPSNISGHQAIFAAADGSVTFIEGNKNVFKLASPATATASSNFVNVGSISSNPDDGATCHASPTMTKAFATSTSFVNSSVALTFTITNSLGNPAVSGLGFVDTLPAGLTFVPGTSVTGTCNVASATETNSVLTVIGLVFANGDTSCTVVADVVGTATGTYTNGPDNMTTTGIDPPLAASITMSNSLPVPVADTTIGKMNTAQTIDPMANDTATGTKAFTPASVKLCAANETPDTCTATTLTVANEGTYTVNATTGVITFTPLSTFSGVATPVTYQVTDTGNATINSTYTPTVVPAPVLTPDTSTGTYLQPQTIASPLDNDNASQLTTLVDSTLKYCATTETPNACTKTSGTITTADGTYAINPDGTLTFTPLASFKGTVTQPLKYQVADAVGNIANSTITPYVTPPALPEASPESKVLLPNAVATFTALTGTGGLAHPSAAGDPAITSACLLVQPANTTCQTTVSGIQTVTIAGEGTYRLTVSTGVVTYTALSTATPGTKTPVTYRATDAVGNTVTSTLTPIIPATPTLSPNTDSTPWDTNKNVDVLANDSADTTNGLTLNPSSLKLCVNTATTCTTTTLTVANQGTYTVNSDGTVKFDPLPTFSGTATPIRYFVADNLGQIKYSTLTMTVVAPNLPVATSDTKTVIPSGTATFPTLKGATGLAQPQTASDPAITSVCLVGTVSTATACDTDGVIAVAGEGTYTLNATTGVVTFVAVAGITAGTKTPMYYKATDAAGNTVKSTLTPVVPAAPTLLADTSSVGWDVTSTVTVLANDSAAAGGTLDPSKVKLCISGNTAPACTGTTLTVANQGTYTVNANGTITFDPLPTFSGTATPVTYSDTDSYGQTRATTLTMTVANPANPVASPSTKTVLAGTSVTFPGITGATGLAQPSAAGNPAITSACLLVQPANTTCATTVVSGSSQTQTITTTAGTFVLNVLTGEVAYTANANASVGNQPAVTYKVTDAAGHTATSNLTPVVPAPPTAVANTNTGNWDIIQTIDVLANDTTSGSATLNPTSVKLCASGDVAPNCTLTTLTVANEGTYTVNSDGTISFDPLSTFTGTATPVRYSVTDSLGLKASATLTPTVLVPAGATALPDSQSVLANTTGPVNSVNFDPILGAGGLATPGASPITSICLVDPATTICAVTTNGTQTVTTSQGTYVLNVTTGVTNFTPANNVTGTLSPITYKVTDASGQVSTSTLTPIIPPLPTAAPDYSQSEIDQPQILSPLGNDTPGAVSAPIVASALCLIDPATSICAVTDPATQKQTITTPNGTYVLDVPTGNVTFTPVAGFLGNAAPATYQITDSLGQTVTGTLNPKTLPKPATTAVPDVPAGVNWSPTVTVVIDPLANDSPGSIPAGYNTTGTVELDPTSVKFCGPTQSVPNCTLTSVTVANEGTYTIDPTTGAITFDPVTSFTGTVTVSPTYMVCNLVTGSWTDPQSASIPTPPNTCATSTVTPSINPVAPLTAIADTSTGEAGVTQIKNVATNDTGVSGNATVKICGDSETSPNCTQTQVTVAGVGTYLVSGTTITFIPLATYTGTPTAMPYAITDELGRSTASTYAPTVTPTTPPTASAESKRVLPGVTANFTTIAGSGGLAVAGARPLTPSLTCLLDGSNGCVQALTTASGTWSVDPTTSVVSFTATQGTAPGNLPSVTYKVFDSVGNTATSTLTPIIPELPVAANDSSTGLVNVNQTISILTNDTSRSATPIVASSIKLCDIGQTGSACINTSVTVAGEGTYSVNSAGLVSFAPANNYIGAATPISYVAVDAMGQATSAAIAVTVTAPAPVANNNSSSGMANVTQSLNIITNDTAASGFSIDATTARLCESQNSCTSTTLTTAEGTFILATTGVLSFEPVSNFVGTVAPISYKVNDTLGQATAATVAITVTPAPAPTAINDSSTGVSNTVQTINVLTGDSATAGYPIVTNAVKLCETTVADSLCSDLQVTVPEGTYEVNGSGVVTFTPNQNYFGTPTPIKYLVTDTYGSQDSATIQPVVTPPALPVVQDNSSVDFKNQVQNFNITNNDTAAPNFTIDASSARLCESANSCTSTTLTVAGQGTYVLSPNGDVVFTPVNNYVGTATPLKYQVRDSVGQAVTAFIRVTVTPTPVPAPVNDASTGPINVPQVVSVLTNDSATPGYPLVISSVKLCDTGETAPNCTATSVVIAGEGTYAVDASGVVTFTPELNYFGTPTPVRYVVTDTYGGKASAVYAPVVVAPAAPVAVNNASTGLTNADQNFNITANDTAATGFSIDPSTAALCQPGQTGVACVSNSVTIAGQGTYVLAPNGDVVFTPVQDYIGTATPVRYVVQDDLGRIATALIQVEVTPTPVPIAVSDSSTGYVNAVQTIRVLANDTETQGYPIDITSVKLCGAGEVAPSCNQTSVTIAGEGTYVVDSSGVVTFTPVPDYVGTPTPVSYVITDSFGSTAHAQIRPNVIAIPVIAPSSPSPVAPEPVKPEPVTPEPVKPTPKPVAKPDQKSSKVNTPVTIKPIANDIKAAVPLVPTTLSLCVTNCDVLAAAGPSTPVAKPIVAKEGTWSVEPTTGNVTFTPVKSWFGRASIKYVVFDQAGNPVISTITVVIPKPKLPKTLVYTGDNVKVAPKAAATKPSVAKPKLIATITAPRLGKNWSKKIYEGTSVAEVLNPLGLGHYEMTAMPGEIGNFAVAGHRVGAGGPFLNIDKFRAGDLVRVTTVAGKTFTYRYLQTKTVKPSAVEVLLPSPAGLTKPYSSDSLLTLQTCTPVHVNSHRLIVWFELVK